MHTFALAFRKHRGVEQLVARQAHNLEVACSNPASATKTNEEAPKKGAFFIFFRSLFGHNSDTTKQEKSTVPFDRVPLSY